MNQRVVLFTLLLAIRVQSAEHKVARGNVLLVSTEEGVQRSLDGGTTFNALPGVDANDTVTAMDAIESTVVIGTGEGDVIEVGEDDDVHRVHLCNAPVERVAAAIASRAVYAACGGSVFVRDDELGTWRTHAKGLGAIQAMAPDPFHGDALFASTASGTYRVSASEGTVRVDGPADDLEVVHAATHSFVAARTGARVRELRTNATSGCDVFVYNFSKNLTTRAEPNPTYDVLYYSSLYRIAVRTSAPTCRWTFDKSTMSSWVHVTVVSGQPVPKSNVTFIGSAVLDISVDRNAGSGRSGSYTIKGPSYNIRSTVSQLDRKTRCIHQPSAIDGTPSVKLSEGEFLILTRHWGEPAVKAPRIYSRLTDRSTCHADPIVWSFSEGFRGSTILSGWENNAPLHVVSSPYVPMNVLGQAALYGLRGNGASAAPSAIASMVLPQLKDLPADLQITKWTMPTTFYSVARSGGAIVISGSVTRSTADPKRQCAFDPKLYTIAGGTWSTISMTESGCEPGSPDRGKIVINIEGKCPCPTHYAFVYAPWGWYALIVQ